VEIAWETWLSKFEALLRTLYWNGAHVYLHTECWGSFHYRWVPSSDIEPNAPPQIWTFSGGPRTGIRDEYRKSDEVGWQCAAHAAPLAADIQVTSHERHPHGNADRGAA
jgi:hypothetical protein